MKPKQITVLALVFAVLVAGIFFNKLQRHPELSTNPLVSLNLSFHPDEVSKIVIRKRSAEAKDSVPQVSLLKKNGGWTVAELWGGRADQTKVDKFLKEIQNAKGEVRGTSREVFGDFGIADDQGFSVSLFSENQSELLGIIIGTRKADYGTLFVRKAGSETVYITEANLFGEMGLYGDPAKDNPSLDYWALKNFAFFDPAEVKKIQISNSINGGGFALANGSAGWQFEGAPLPFGPGPEKVSQYLSNLKSYAAQTVVNPDGKDYGFDKPSLKAVFTLTDGKNYEITVGAESPKDKSVSYMRVSGEPVVYLMSKFYFENLAPAPIYFLSDNLLGIDLSKLEKLTVHADKTELSFQPAVKKWDALAQYIDGLKTFKIQPITAGKYKFGRYWIELKKKDEAQATVIEVADTAVGESRLYPAQKRGTGFTFGISETLFHQLFDNPSRLAEPKS